MPWVLDPHSGGVKIPKLVQERVRRRLIEYANKKYAGRFTRLDIRFRGVFCYIDAFVEPKLPPGRLPRNWPETREQMIERLRKTPLHLCRLRHFQENRWSLDFFTYSNEKYTPSVFPSGEFFGTPEEGFDTGAMYLSE